MDVQLYIYDLTRGLARQMSRQLLGIQIDAVYHTSIVIAGVEYFFGRGIHTCYPGMTHHGQPMETISLGKTELPIEIILEYLESLKQTYSPESYDLFAHNCNNFTNDFAMFLVGKGIPSHITSLPRRFLKTPFGQMIRPQIEQAMRPVTQGAITQQEIPKVTASNSSNGQPASLGRVHNASNLESLDQLLDHAGSSCAVIFFTSQTCLACKLAYPTFDELAEETGAKCTLVKVDIEVAPDVAAKYMVRKSATFITFIKGQQDQTWTGADSDRLRNTVRLLVQSAFPMHPHEKLKLSAFRKSSLQPVIYSKSPPLDKLVTKMGDMGGTDVVTKVVDFVKASNTSGKPSQDIPLPDLTGFAKFLLTAIDQLPVENLFATYDLFRLLLSDRRAGDIFSKGDGLSTAETLLRHVTTLHSCPYNLRLVAIHVACNLSSVPIFTDHSLSNPDTQSLLTTLVTQNLLDRDNPKLRIAAASLAYNIATAEYNHRTQQGTLSINGISELLSQNTQVALAAAVLEALSADEEVIPEAVRGLTLALARLVYGAPQDSEVPDLCEAMDAGATLTRRGDVLIGTDRDLVHEIARELLGHAHVRA